MPEENIEPQVEQETVVEEEPTIEGAQEQEPSEDKIVLTKADYNKLNRKAIAYESLKKNPPIINQEKSINTIDQIKLGKKLVDYSDEELDFLVDMAKSKDPEVILKTLENPYVQAGIQANRQKVEKERLTLKPNSTQSESDTPVSLEYALANAKNDSEREEILREAGLYSEPRRRTDGPQIRV